MNFNLWKFATYFLAVIVIIGLGLFIRKIASNQNQATTLSDTPASTSQSNNTTLNSNFSSVNTTDEKSTPKISTNSTQNVAATATQNLTNDNSQQIVVSQESRNVLSRKLAGELIVKSLNLPIEVPILIDKIWTKECWSDNGGVCLLVGKQYSDVKQSLDGLQAKGLINLGEEQQRQGTNRVVIATVDLTDEGKKYLFKDDRVSFWLKGSVITFGEVTGIQIFEQSKTARVDYTLKRTIISPFRSSVTERRVSNFESEYSTQSRNATFELYDDGWRIKNL